MNNAAPEFEVRVVRRIHGDLTLDLTIRLDREIGVLFGPSGAGKTSILRMITGLSRPDEGSIRLGDSILFDSAHGFWFGEQISFRQRGDAELTAKGVDPALHDTHLVVGIFELRFQAVDGLLRFLF